MSAERCTTTEPAVDNGDEREAPWWRDPDITIPVSSGVAFVTGLVLGVVVRPDGSACLLLGRAAAGRIRVAPGALRN